ncbi:MAG: DNA cytosine methyltransferase [Thermodesulfovibrionales bacterium]|jgi:DNA (cytosine-5)-methyltransferase 1
MTVVDLFSGCGGLSRGFLDAGCEVMLGIDTDQAALATFEKNHGFSKTLNADVSSRQIIKAISDATTNKPVDIIVGGPPCQGFSLTGPRNFDDERNRLYLAHINVVKELRPKAFLVENVPGLLTLYGGRIREEILRRFTSVGYNVSFKILCAADYGVPQMRKRVFFVGLRKEYGWFDFPSPTHTPGNYVTCADAIDDLPSRDDNPGQEEDDYDLPPRSSYQAMMRKGSNKLFNHVATQHTQMVKEVMTLVPEGGNYKDLPLGVGESRKFNEAWTRYHSKKPSRTIDTGHRNHFHYKYNRVPTVRENARLQSFPDSFVFYGNRTQKYRQVGNAVPPLLGYHLAKKLLYHLNALHIEDDNRSDPPSEISSNGEEFQLFLELNNL